MRKTVVILQFCVFGGGKMFLDRLQNFMGTFGWLGHARAGAATRFSDVVAAGWWCKRRDLNNHWADSLADLDPTCPIVLENDPGVRLGSRLLGG